MGFNIAGLIIKGQTSLQKIESLLNQKLDYKSSVDFEEATSSYRNENTIDVLQTKEGTLILTELRQIYDLSSFQEDVVQFMISDISDTYYFEKFSDGKLERKYVISQGEVAEDIGKGIINEDDDLIEKVWEFTDKYLQNNFLENMFQLKFNQYLIK